MSVIRAFTGLAVLLVAAGVTSAFWAADAPTPVAPKDLPSAVTKGETKTFPKLKVEEAEKYNDKNGKTVYQIEGEDANGMDEEVVIGEDGAPILEQEELLWKDLPTAVQDALKKLPAEGQCDIPEDVGLTFWDIADIELVKEFPGAKDVLNHLPECDAPMGSDTIYDVQLTKKGGTGNCEKTQKWVAFDEKGKQLAPTDGPPIQSVDPKRKADLEKKAEKNIK